MTESRVVEDQGVRVDRLGSPWRMVGGEKGWAGGLGRTVEDAHLVPAQRLDDRLELRHGHVVLNTPQRSTPLRAFDSSIDSMARMAEAYSAGVDKEAAMGPARLVLDVDGHSVDVVVARVVGDVAQLRERPAQATDSDEVVG